MECTVCSNKFNKTNFAPRILKCGHSICHSCLCLMHKNLKFHYTCNICGETYPCAIADCPLNLPLIDMITQGSETSTGKCCSHDRKLAKLHKCCKTPDCENKQTSNLVCEDRSLKGCLRKGFDIGKISHLTHLVNAYKEKKRRLENMIKYSNIDESAFMKCIQDDRLFLKNCLKDTESILVKIDSLVMKKAFTSVAEYTNYEKELEQFAKFDANVENVCNTGWHPSSNVLFENLKILNCAMREKLTRNNGAYFSFWGDNYHHIVKKGDTFRVNLDENSFSSSELPVNSLLFKGESWSYYTFWIKFANGGSEARLSVDLDLRNIENKPLQELFKWLKGGQIFNQIRFQMCQNVLYLGDVKWLSNSAVPLPISSCVLNSSEMSNIDLLGKNNINGLGIAGATELRVDCRSREYRSPEEKGKAIDKSKLSILAYFDTKGQKYEFYFMKCGIGFIGEGVTLIGYHDMDMEDVDCNSVWSAELEFF